jgi:tetratricopeptide (TPR) repeat protein
LSAEEAGTLESALARMVEGKRVTTAARREDSRYLVRIRLEGYGATSDGLELTGGIGSGGIGGELEVADPSQPTSSARVVIGLVDVLEGITLLERAVKCRLPLTERGRITDPALRANLSHVVDVMEKSARSIPRDQPEEAYGPDEGERKRLGQEELARVLSREAARATRRGFGETALALLAEAQPLFKTVGLRREEGLIWERLAGATASTGRPLERAIDYAQQAVRLARESSDRTAEARALTCLAVIEARAANYPRSLELLQAARRMSKDEGDALTEATALANVAGLTAIRGSFERARSLHQEALLLAGETGSRRAAARFLVSAALIQSHLDRRDREKALELLARARDVARDTGDLSIERDVAFAQAKVRFSTTDLRHLMEGEVDAIRALQLSRDVGDREGEAAAFALLGAFSHRLVRPELAAEYLALAQQKARAGGHTEIVIDGLQLLGDMAPNTERALSFLEEVLALRRQSGDLRGEVKTLSDMSRLLSALRREDLARERHREAVDALERYVAGRAADPFREDIEASLVVSLKSLMATRTELPYLERYLAIRNLTIVPDPTWTEEAK